MLTNTLSDIEDIEVSTEAMFEALTRHNQPALLRALSMLSPEKVTRRCIYVVDATDRLHIPSTQVDEFFATARTIEAEPIDKAHNRKFENTAATTPSKLLPNRKRTPTWQALPSAPPSAVTAPQSPTTPIRSPA